MARKKKLPPGVRERDGRYTFRYSVTEIISGKKHRKQKETPAYATALEAYDAGILIKAEIIKGTYLDADNILFEQWVDKFFEIYERNGKKKKGNTLKVRRGSLKRPLMIWTGRKLKDITALDYQELLNGMKDEGLSQNTISQTWTTMSLLFKRAIKKPYTLIAHDITKDVEFPDFSRSVEDLESLDPTELYLEKEDLALFLRTAKEMIADADNEDQAFLLAQFYRAFFVLAYSGLRIGELCALEEKDLIEIKKQLRIIKNLDAKNGVKKYIIDTPKTDSSVRDVDITDRVITTLKTQLLERKKFKLLRGSKYHITQHDFIFVNARNLPGCPMSSKDVEEQMKLVLYHAKLPLHLTPHNLRHTYVSLLAEARIDLHTVQRQIGHTKDAKTTLIYNHVTKARMRADMEKLDALIDGIET